MIDLAPPAAPSTSSSATAARCGCGRRPRRTTPALIGVLRRPLATAAASSASTASPSPASGSSRTLRRARLGRARRARSASSGDAGDETVVAVGNYVRLRDPPVGRGGVRGRRRLPAAGASAPGCSSSSPARAAAHGIEAFVAEVLPENRSDAVRVRERRLRADAHARRRRGRGEVPDRARPTRYRARVDERDHVAVTASLRPFFEPRTVAVVGASARRGLDRRRAVPQHPRRRLHRRRLPGQPRRRARRRRARLHARSRRSPTRSTSCVICLPGEHVLAAAEDALRPGTRALASSRPGSPRSGRRGASARSELLALVRAHGARLVGPNCLGIASRRRRPERDVRARARSRRAGSASRRRAARSGSRCSSGPRRAGSASRRSSRSATRPTSRRTTCSSGGRTTPAPTSSCSTSSRSATRASSRASRAALAREKPILAMKSGRSRAGPTAAGSHTAALAGSDTAVDALFRQAGVHPRGHARGAARRRRAALDASRAPRGRRVAVLTNAGGLGILCADACEAAGLELPVLAEETRARARRAPPVRGERPRTRSTCSARRRRRASDVGAAARARRSRRRRRHRRCSSRPSPSTPADVGAAISRGRGRRASRTSRCSPSILAADGAPATLRSRSPGRRRSPIRRPQRRHSGERPSAATGCAGRPGRVPRARRDRRRRGRGGRRRRRSRTATRPGSSPAETRGCSLAYGIPLVAERVAATPEEAVAAAAELGYPVVVKTAAAGAHKTETGGVALDLADDEAVRAAARAHRRRR